MDIIGKALEIRPPLCCVLGTFVIVQGDQNAVIEAAVAAKGIEVERTVLFEQIKGARLMIQKRASVPLTSHRKS